MSLNNLDLIKFCQSKIGTNYVYGAKGEVLTQAKYDWLKNAYGSYVWNSDTSKIGTWCVDCSGLISWYTGKVRGSSQYYSLNSPQPISTIASAPLGVAVWHSGHIGVYIGNGKCIEAKGSAYGTVISNLSACKFTHWFKIGDINYIEEVVTPTPVVYTQNASTTVDYSKIIVDGVEHSLNMINKEGYTYLKTRDIAPILGYNISANGSTPVFTKK